MEDYAILARKYYKVLNLFFWWVSNCGVEECNLVLCSSLFGKFCGKIENLHFEGKNFFSAFCVVTNGCKFFRSVGVVEKKLNGFTRFLVENVSRFQVRGFLIFFDFS